MNRDAGIDGYESNNFIARNRLAAFGNLRHQVTHTMNIDIIARSARLFLLFNLLERIGLGLGFGLQIPDYLRRSNQTASNIGEKLIAFVAFKMSGQVL